MRRSCRPADGRRSPWETFARRAPASETATASGPKSQRQARRAPGIRESAGKKKGKGSTGHGNAYLASILGNAAAGAGKTSTFLGERYRRIARRRGSKRAIVAISRSIMVIAWHLLADPDAA